MMAAPDNTQAFIDAPNHCTRDVSNGEQTKEESTPMGDVSGQPDIQGELKNAGTAPHILSTRSVLEDLALVLSFIEGTDSDTSLEEIEAANTRLGAVAESMIEAIKNEAQESRPPAQQGSLAEPKPAPPKIPTNQPESQQEDSH